MFSLSIIYSFHVLSAFFVDSIMMN